jgi:RES domain.
MEDVMPAIDYYYMDADGNISYDPEEGAYIGRAIDNYDFVYEILAEEMQIEDTNLLDELFNLIEPRTWVSTYEYYDRTLDRDLKAWARYTRLINDRDELSVEQIVSLCANPDAPPDLQEIHEVLREVLFHAIRNEFREMYSYTSINTGIPLYRCVNFHPMGYKPFGYDEIPATLVGTAPAEFAEMGRFNEKGDMMFYGASNPETAMSEVVSKDGNPYTIGEFHTNKRARVLNLCAVGSWKRLSAFSLEQDDMDRQES